MGGPRRLWLDTWGTPPGGIRISFLPEGNPPKKGNLALFGLGLLPLRGILALDG